MSIENNDKPSLEENFENYKAGFVAIVGAPNAGKSTLLNYVLGEKIAAVSPKPQTTRHRILAVHSEANAQIVFWDTPGLHDSYKDLLNQEMMKRALAALEDCDLALLIVDAQKQGREHKLALEILSEQKKFKVIVALNKIDLIPDKKQILPLIQEIEDALNPLLIVPVSAKKGDGVEILLDQIIKHLPNNPPFYPEDTLTDQPQRQIAAEMVREAVFKMTSQEIPYSTAVTIDEFTEGESLISIAATIHVEKESQKGVVIGKGGLMLKKIGRSARINIENLLGEKVFLKLFVRTTQDWSKKKSSLLEFGYGD